MTGVTERSGEWGRTWELKKADDELTIIIWGNGSATVATYESASLDTAGTAAELLPDELKSLRDWLNASAP